MNMKWIGISSAVIILIAIVLTILVSNYNSMINQEASIKAEWQNMESVLGNLITNKIKVMAAGTKDYSKTYIAGIAAQAERYKNDSGLMMKMITEAQSSAPAPEVWTNVQNAVSDAYDQFALDQKQKIDKVAAYDAYTKRFPTTLIAGMFGFPSPEIKKIMGMVVSTKQAKAAMESGEFNPDDPFK